MDVINIKKGGATVFLTTAELAFLGLAVEGALSTIKPAGFRTRTGATVEEATRLSDELIDLRDKSVHEGQ